MYTNTPTKSRRPETIKSTKLPENWCAIEGICSESRSNYRVIWEGLNPETGLPWETQWVPKNDVTIDCINEWKAWKASHPDLKYRDLSIHPFDDAFAPSQVSSIPAESISQHSACGISTTDSSEPSTFPRRQIAAKRIIFSSQSDLDSEVALSNKSSPAITLIAELPGRNFVAVQVPRAANDAPDLPYYSQTQTFTQSSTSQPSTQVDSIAKSAAIPDSQAVITIESQRTEGGDTIIAAVSSPCSSSNPAPAQTSSQIGNFEEIAGSISGHMGETVHNSSHSIMSEANPSASGRDAPHESAHVSQPDESALPNIVETQPTPPGSSEAYKISQYTSSGPTRSPSPSQLRNRAQSPFSAHETPTRKISDLRNTDLTVPLLLFPDVKKTYGEQIKWAYQEGRLGDLMGASAHSTTDFDFEAAVNVTTKLLGLTLHPDLILRQDILSQYPPDQFAKYSESVSSKFAFLSSLLSALRGQSKHIAIVVTSGLPTKLLEQFLQGIEAPYGDTDRQEHGSVRHDEPRLRVFNHQSLLSPNEQPFDLVIGLDQNFSLNDSIAEQCRQLSLSSQRACLIIHLVIPYSMEHILGRLSPQNMDKKELKQAFTLSIKLGSYLRNLSRDRLSPTVVANEIVAHISPNTHEDESLLPLLDDYAFPPHLRPPHIEDQPASLKRRANDLIDQEATNKRPRSETPAQNSALRNDMTHVTDTSVSSGTASRVAANAPTSTRARDSEIDMLHKIIQQLESGNKQLNAENNEIKKQLAKAAAIELRSARVQETNDSLREKSRQYEVDLAAARALHAQSANPEIRELAELRQRASHAIQLEKDLQATKQTLDYITARYHEMEQSASESRDAISELERSNRALQAKAEGEARLSQEAMARTIAVANTGGVKKANKEKQIMEDLLRRKDVELIALKEENERMKERLGAGISTRASVRANSPAMGSRVGTPVGGTSMSRAGSRSGTPQPMPGAARSGLKLTMGPANSHRSHLRE